MSYYSRIVLIILFINFTFAFIVKAADKFNSPDSSFISGATYDANKRTLTIEMHNNDTKKQYQYNNVDKKMFEEFKKAESKGQFFNKNIKNYYDYQRIR